MNEYEMAEMLDLRTALSWHLRHNHYPAVPYTMIDPCIAAIDAANEGDFYAEIDLPAGVTYKGHEYAPAQAIIQQHHLFAWVTYE